MFMNVNLIKLNLFLLICLLFIYLFIYFTLILLTTLSYDLSVYILHTCNHCSPRLANLLMDIAFCKICQTVKQLNSEISVEKLKNRKHAHACVTYETLSTTSIIHWSQWR